MPSLKLIVAGILSIPCFLVSIVTAPIIALLAIPPLFLLLFRKEKVKQQQPERSEEGKGKRNNDSDEEEENYLGHVLIFGGSSGIGLAIANECIRRCYHRSAARCGRSSSATHEMVTTTMQITILARDPIKLDQAKQELQQQQVRQQLLRQEAILEQQQQQQSPIETIRIGIDVISVDVTDYKQLQIVAKRCLTGNNSINNNNSSSDNITVFNCAGIPYTTEYDHIPVEKYEQVLQTNVLGAMYVTKAVLPYMDKQGCLVYCASAAGQVGMYGYTAYSPTKYALRGYVEALQQELLRTKPHVSVQLAFPIDTNTPGYHTEYQMMPELTKVLNATTGLATAKDTAQIMVEQARVFPTRTTKTKTPTFHVYFTLEGWILSNLTVGMAPVTNLFDAITQISLLNIFRLISLFVVNDWYETIRSYDKNKNNPQNSSDACSSSNNKEEEGEEPKKQK